MIIDFIYFHNSEKEAKANVLNTDNVLISFLVPECPLKEILTLVWASLPYFSVSNNIVSGLRD